MRLHKITAAQAEEIMASDELKPILAERYGISVSYVREIQRGHYAGSASKLAPIAAPPPPASGRFYRPFRDGTYSV